MKHIALFAILFSAITTPAFSNTQKDDTIIVSTDEHHEYISPDREIMEFQNKKIILEVYYKNSPSRELSKISVTCLGQHKSFAYDHTYFVDRILPLVDTRHDQHGRVIAAYFQLEMRTERNLKEPDRVVYIECANSKIETSILGEAIVP